MNAGGGPEGGVLGEGGGDEGNGWSSATLAVVGAEEVAREEWGERVVEVGSAIGVRVRKSSASVGREINDQVISCAALSIECEPARQRDEILFFRQMAVTSLGLLGHESGTKAHVLGRLRNSFSDLSGDDTEACQAASARVCLGGSAG